MQKEMKLKCTVTGMDDSGRYTCVAKLVDGSEFTVQVFEKDVILQGELTEEITNVDGWIFVLQEAQQNNQVSITLPQPSDVHGRQILVDQYQLMPRNATIENFGIQKN